MISSTNTMSNLPMALSHRYTNMISCSRLWQAQVSVRSFTASCRWTEDQQKKEISPKAQARLDAAEAIQNLARSRSSNANGPTIRRTLGVTTATPQRRAVSPQVPFSSTNREGAGENRQPRAYGAPSRSFGRPGQGRFPSRGQPGQSAPSRRPRFSKRGVEDDWAPEKRQSRPKGKDEPELTPEQLEEVLQRLGVEEPFQVKQSQGPHLDMVSMMMEYAPRSFGAIGSADGKYPAVVDEKKRGLMHDIVKQVRRNETYTEKDIDQMLKKLGPSMPRA